MTIRSAFLLMLLAGTSASAQDVDQALLNRFLEAVPRTTKIVEQISVRVRCASTVDLVTNSEAGKVEMRDAGFDPNKKEIGETSNVAVRGSWGLKESTTPRKGIVYIIAKNSEYAFRINRSSQLKGYTIEFLEQLGNDPVADEKIQQADSACRFCVVANWSMFTQPLSHLIKSPFLKIKRVSAVPSDGADLVRIDFDHLIDDPDRKKERLSDAYLVCDPANAWALREYGATLFHGGTNRLIIEFGELVNGFPIAKKITSLYSLPKVSQVTRRTVTTVEVSSQVVPKEEFYLSHYGLPEPTFRRGWFGTWVWYLFAGIVCLGVSYVIVKRRRAAIG